MKTYKIVYKPMIKPLFKLSDPYDIHAFPMPEFTGYGTVSGEREETVTAPNKQIAKSMLACSIMSEHLGAGYDIKPIIIQSLQNIVTIEELNGGSSE
ncbi:hypothetical protein P4T89_08525 [Bacillus nakamurai]|uniref:Uncharacterized protein n=1 Tax=Bacillus nakamurai TaxID=1793963 RepID=A0A150F5R3_9BACI|nr:hypothetical protein [Bacillus nakamurai]KXZ17735.1 hypothetical protein AXI58_18520 [Bacillus nakamurai]MED1227635.1 hypothetical protein [Bacillus nakamurai]